jgi:hypothetical protein
MAHYLLTSQSVMKKDTDQSNHFGRISENSDTSSRRASGRSLGTYSTRRHWYHKYDSSMQVIAHEDPPVGQDVEVKDIDIDDPDPL